MSLFRLTAVNMDPVVKPRDDGGKPRDDMGKYRKGTGRGDDQNTAPQFQQPNFALVVLPIVLAMLFLLTACSGWHLRGYATPPDFLKQLRIIPNTPYTKLQRELRAQLTAAKISVSAASATDAITTLEILRDEAETKDQTIGIDGEVKEIAITYHLQYQLTNAQGEIMIPKSAIKITRSQPFNQQRILSAQVDQESIIQTLRIEASSRLLRRLFLTTATPVKTAPKPPTASPYSLNPLSGTDETAP